MKNDRVVSLDFLKIFAMFLIVLQHLLDFVGYLTIKLFKIEFISIYFFEAFSIVAVNVFVLITGFFLIEQKFKWQKLFSLLFEVAVFSWIILFISKLLGIQNISPNTTFDFIFPTFSGLYWFISSYIVLYLIFPFINKFIYALSNQQLKMFAIITLILCCLWKYNFSSKSVLWLIVVYFWGACIRLVIENKKQNFLFLTDKKSYNVLLYILCSLVSMISYIYLNIKGKTFVNLLIFNNIVVFCASLFLFLFVYKIKIQKNFFSKIIILIAPASLGVYLIHMHPLVSYPIAQILRNITLPYNNLSLSILFFSLFIFITCLILSFIVHKLIMFVSYQLLCPNIEKFYNNIKQYNKND